MKQNVGCVREVSFIPDVEHLEVKNEFFDISKFSSERLLYIATPAEFAKQMKTAAAQLTVGGLPCRLQSEINNVVERIAALVEDTITVIKDTAIVHPEGYELKITPTEISIKASTAAGAFYAMQSVRELVLTYVETKKIPCVTVIDKPQSEWRGLMIDTCRTFYPVEFLEKMIDIMAMHKMNRFHWHLTDDQGWRFNVPEYPRLVEVGSVRDDRRYTWVNQNKALWYTDEQITHLVSYAADRCVTVVPEVETPGHASALLAAYPEYGCTGGPYRVEDRFGIFDDVLCSGNDAVFTMYESIFDTVCRLFPGPYIHIGGDECPRTNWKKCPKCQQRIKDEHLSSENELQSYMTVRFASMVEKRGRIPVGWDEVLDGTEKLGLPHSMIVQSWRGFEGGRKAASMGHKVIMSPQTNGCYLDWYMNDDGMEPGNQHLATVSDSWSFSPVQPDMNKKDASMILGGQCNLWTEVIYAPRIAEYMIFPRLCAIADKVWHYGPSGSFNDFATRLAVHKERLSKLNVLYYDGPLSK